MDDKEYKIIFKKLVNKTYSEKELVLLPIPNYRVLGDKDVLALADFLCVNQTLKTLQLRIENCPMLLSKGSRKILADAICANQGLERLNLTLGMVDEEDAEIFATALEQNKNIKLLSLRLIGINWVASLSKYRENDIASSAILLTKRIIKNPKLIEIDTTGIFFQTITVNRLLLENLPEKSNIAKIIFCPHADLGPYYKHLCNIKPYHAKLQLHDLFSDCLKTLLPVLSTIKLTKLSLRFCYLQAEEICQILKACPHLKEFELDLSPLAWRNFDYYLLVAGILEHTALSHISVKIPTHLYAQEIVDVLKEHVEENRQRAELESKKLMLSWLLPYAEGAEPFDAYLTPFIMEPADFVKPSLWK